MPELEALAKKTKKVRTDQRESQMTFAAHCGISTEALSKIERQVTDPKLSTIQKVAAYTGWTVSELLEPEAPDAPSSKDREAVTK